MSAKISQASQSVPGLDRAHIDADGKIQHPSELLNSPSNDSGFDELDAQGDDGEENHHKDDPEPLSKRKRLSLKTKKVLHIGGNYSPKITPTAPVLADAPDTISNSRLVHPIPKQEDHKFKDVLHHPVDTITSKVTGQGGQQVASNLVAKEISHGKEVELVQAQDEILNAKTDPATVLAIEEVGTLVKRRQDMFVRWTIDRHVTKVRILPEETVSKKEPKDFLILTDGKPRTDWIAYLNHVCHTLCTKCLADDHSKSNVTLNSMAVNILAQQATHPLQPRKSSCPALSGSSSPLPLSKHSS